MSKEKLVRLGNIYNENAGTGHAGNVWDKNGICPTITTCQGGGREPMIVEVKETMQIFESNVKGTVLVEKDGRYFKIRIRKLTPRECGRLMGVSDEDITKMQNVNSNTQLYKGFGNSIVVNCMEAMFRNLNIKGVERFD